MSMDRCELCGDIFDTDGDPDCYRSKKDPHNYIEDWVDDDSICVCINCRDERGLDEYEDTRYSDIDQ